MLKVDNRPAIVSSDNKATLKCSVCQAEKVVSRSLADSIVLADYICGKPSCRWAKMSESDRIIAAVKKGLGENFVREGKLPYLRTVPVSGADKLSYRDSLYITGPVGTGKTLLLNALLVDALEHGCVNISLINWSDFKREIEATYHHKSIVTRLDVYEKYRRQELLLIDDIGVGASEDGEESRHAKEMMYDLINDRYYKHQPFHITTNIKPKDLPVMYDARVSRRINESCKTFVLKEQLK